MELFEKLRKLSVDVPRRLKYATDESNTGSYLIEPFMLALGYDATEPDDVRKELTADVGRGRNKADYVIKQRGKEIILVEIKPVGTDLADYVAQLDGYFRNKEDIKFGLLSDGIDYWFFSDFDNPNVMDRQPFLKLDLRNLDDSIIDIVEVIGLFTKDGFHQESSVEAARHAKDRFQVRSALLAEVNPLSDGLVSYFIDKVSPGRMTRSRREELATHVERTWQEFLRSQAKDDRQITDTLQLKPEREDTVYVLETSKRINSGDGVPIPVQIDYSPRGSKKKYVLEGTLYLADNIGRNQDIIEYEGEILPPSEAAGRAIRSVNPGVSNPNGWRYWTFVNPNTGRKDVIDLLTNDPRLRRQLLQGHVQL